MGNEDDDNYNKDFYSAWGPTSLTWEAMKSAFKHVYPSHELDDEHNCIHCKKYFLDPVSADRECSKHPKHPAQMGYDWKAVNGHPLIVHPSMAEQLAKLLGMKPESGLTNENLSPILYPTGDDPEDK